MTTLASQITSLTVVYSIAYSGVDQRKHQSSASLAFVRGIHRTGEFPAQRASNAENVSIWWRHHAIVIILCVVLTDVIQPVLPSKVPGTQAQWNNTFLLHIPGWGLLKQFSSFVFSSSFSIIIKTPFVCYKYHFDMWRSWSVVQVQNRYGSSGVTFIKSEKPPWINHWTRL